MVSFIFKYFLILFRFSFYILTPSCVRSFVHFVLHLCISSSFLNIDFLIDFRLSVSLFLVLFCLFFLSFFSLFHSCMSLSTHFFFYISFIWHSRRFLSIIDILFIFAFSFSFCSLVFFFLFLFCFFHLFFYFQFLDDFYLTVNIFYSYSFVDFLYFSFSHSRFSHDFSSNFSSFFCRFSRFSPILNVTHSFFNC